MTTAVRSRMFGVLVGSDDSRARERRPSRRAHEPNRGREPQERETNSREKGVALILAMSTIAILAVVLADMHQNTATSFALAASQRDRLRAEYMARSGINLTRMLVANEEPIRAAVAPVYRMMLQRDPPQLPIWSYASAILEPFCNYEGAQENRDLTGVDLSAATGMGPVEEGEQLPTCELVAFAENSKLNLNNPLHLQGQRGQLNVAQQVYAMTGGYQPQSPYDALFEERDGDGLITTRLDIVSALIDWWDFDTQRATFDPGANTISPASGAEDDVYAQFRDPYQPRNAPLDSVEELRLIRGVGDDFWSTFIEPDPDDPTSRTLTVYGSGRVHLNEARAEVLLARTCAIIPQSTLCTVAESQKFLMVINTARALAPVPWFTNVQDYLRFLEGGGTGTELRPMLESMGGANGLLPAPVQINAQQRRQFNQVFLTSAAIIFVQSTGRIGACSEDPEERGPGRCTSIRIRSVINFDRPWTPPPPNAGAMPRLGVFHHWRVD